MLNELKRRYIKCKKCGRKARIQRYKPNGMYYAECRYCGQPYNTRTRHIQKAIKQFKSMKLEVIE